MTRPAAYRNQAQTIQESAKFQRQSDGQWQAVPFPGFTVMTPPWEDSQHGTNDTFYTQLKQCQATLLKKLPTDLLIPVPPGSFHMTLADLIWDGAYRHANQDPAFEARLRDRITLSFEQVTAEWPDPTPVDWQALGLIIMPRAIGIGLVPNHESAYDRVLALRRAIYQNPGLIALGIEQQYHLTAHITLGYFGDVAGAQAGDPAALAEQLSQTLTELNDAWLEDSSLPIFRVDEVQLRRFADMNRYEREPDWPVLKF